MTDRGSLGRQVTTSHTFFNCTRKSPRVKPRLTSMGWWTELSSKEMRVTLLVVAACSIRAAQLEGGGDE